MHRTGRHLLAVEEQRRKRLLVGSLLLRNADVKEEETARDAGRKGRDQDRDAPTTSAPDAPAGPAGPSGPPRTCPSQRRTLAHVRRVYPTAACREQQQDHPPASAAAPRSDGDDRTATAAAAAAAAHDAHAAAAAAAAASAAPALSSTSVAAECEAAGALETCWRAWEQTATCVLYLHPLLYGPAPDPPALAARERWLRSAVHLAIERQLQREEGQEQQRKQQPEPRGGSASGGGGNDAVGSGPARQQRQQQQGSNVVGSFLQRLKLRSQQESQRLALGLRAWSSERAAEAALRRLSITQLAALALEVRSGPGGGGAAAGSAGGGIPAAHAAPAAAAVEEAWHRLYSAAAGEEARLGARAAAAAAAAGGSGGSRGSSCEDAVAMMLLRSAVLGLLLLEGGDAAAGGPLWPPEPLACALVPPLRRLMMARALIVDRTSAIEGDILRTHASPAVLYEVLSYAPILPYTYGGSPAAAAAASPPPRYSSTHLSSAIHCLLLCPMLLGVLASLARALMLGLPAEEVADAAEPALEMWHVYQELVARRGPSGCDDRGGWDGGPAAGGAQGARELQGGRWQALGRDDAVELQPLYDCLFAVRELPAHAVQASAPQPLQSQRPPPPAAPTSAAALPPVAPTAASACASSAAAYSALSALATEGLLAAPTHDSTAVRKLRAVLGAAKQTLERGVALYGTAVHDVIDQYEATAVGLWEERLQGWAVQRTRWEAQPASQRLSRRSGLISCPSSGARELRAAAEELLPGLLAAQPGSWGRLFLLLGREEGVRQEDEKLEAAAGAGRGGARTSPLLQL
ncbi:hypothetical protein GPECTOR_850g91 [Gonium pectorale]|uniref:Uncharacterized protein n=1 Tax=Gonium pectorale TaxID=33097 RepID=A0A150FTY1_GONPE|nr:hypothetical protein GPECTOR_850g91 [Gonium pectorale]|eukprot:KXZ41071.1 hypothetical protein GPECTOR_850g91 [Gonium pectorale]